MTIDKEKLKALAEAASASDATKVELWYLYEDLNPAAVLSLLAEIEHLQDLVAEWRRSSPVLPSRACAAIIDQLKAENAQLKNQEIELKAENESLRKDAERYRFTSRLLVDMGALPQSWGAMTYEKFDEMCDQAMADAGMAKPST